MPAPGQSTSGATQGERAQCAAAIAQNNRQGGYPRTTPTLYSTPMVSSREGQKAWCRYRNCDGPSKTVREALAEDRGRLRMSAAGKHQLPVVSACLPAYPSWSDFSAPRQAWRKVRKRQPASRRPNVMASFAADRLRGQNPTDYQDKARLCLAQGSNSAPHLEFLLLQ